MPSPRCMLYDMEEWAAFLDRRALSPSDAVETATVVDGTITTTTTTTARAAVTVLLARAICVVDSTLRAVAQVFLANNPISGMLILIGLALSTDPQLAWFGFVGALMGNLGAMFAYRGDVFVRAAALKAKRDAVGQSAPRQPQISSDPNTVEGSSVVVGADAPRPEDHDTASDRPHYLLCSDTAGGDEFRNGLLGYDAALMACAMRVFCEGVPSESRAAATSTIAGKAFADPMGAASSSTSTAAQVYAASPLGPDATVIAFALGGAFFCGVLRPAFGRSIHRAIGAPSLDRGTVLFETTTATDGLFSSLVGGGVRIRGCDGGGPHSPTASSPRQRAIPPRNSGGCEDDQVHAGSSVNPREVRPRNRKVLVTASSGMTNIGTFTITFNVVSIAVILACQRGVIGTLRLKGTGALTTSSPVMPSPNNNSSFTIQHDVSGGGVAYFFDMWLLGVSQFMFVDTLAGAVLVLLGIALCSVPGVLGALWGSLVSGLVTLYLFQPTSTALAAGIRKGLFGYNAAGAAAAIASGMFLPGATATSNAHPLLVRGASRWSSWRPASSLASPPRQRQKHAPASVAEASVTGEASPTGDSVVVVICTTVAASPSGTGVGEGEGETTSTTAGSPMASPKRHDAPIRIDYESPRHGSSHRGNNNNNNNNVLRGALHEDDECAADPRRFSSPVNRTDPHRLDMVASADEISLAKKDASSSEFLEEEEEKKRQLAILRANHHDGVSAKGHHPARVDTETDRLFASPKAFLQEPQDQRGVDAPPPASTAANDNNNSSTAASGRASSDTPSTVTNVPGRVWLVIHALLAACFSVILVGAFSMALAPVPVMTLPFISTAYLFLLAM